MQQLTYVEAGRVEWEEVEAPAIGTVYAAYRPLIVSLPPTAYRYNPDGSIELRRPLGRGSEYTVQSLRPRVTADILRESPKLGPNGNLSQQGWGVLKNRFRQWMVKQPACHRRGVITHHIHHHITSHCGSSPF